VFIASGTEQGDLMGIAYYCTNAEGYMHHYGVEVEVRFETYWRGRQSSPSKQLTCQSN
jgi:hypothetical protein